MACNHFGNRVLDLDSRVRLNEIELVVLVQKKLNRCSVDVVGLFYNPQGGFAEFFPRVFV
jgi:hypothetical protein